MGSLLHAADAFIADFRSIAWTWVPVALACQLGKMAARSRAWRNVLTAAYPQTNIRWRSIFGAHAAGAGVNAIVPARGGDLLKLYLVRRRVAGASYSTLTASLFVGTIVDSVLSCLLLLWALRERVLPGVGVVNRLPSVDWLRLTEHPFAVTVSAAVALLVSLLVGRRAAARLERFGRRVASGFAIVRTPGPYLRGVVAWQLVDWALRLATIYFLLRAFHITASLDTGLRVQVTQSLSTIVPLTPAGLGTEQALLVYVLAGFAPYGKLLALGVGMKAILSALDIAIAVPALALMLGTLRWRRVLEAERVRRPQPHRPAARGRAITRQPAAHPHA